MLGLGSSFVCISRCIGLSLSLPSSYSMLSFREQLIASDYYPQNSCALSPFLSPGGYCPAGSSAVTSCPAGAIPSTGCFDYTSLLCTHHCLMSCLVGFVEPSTLLYHLLTRICTVKIVYPPLSSRLLLSRVHLNACVRIGVRILFITRFCRYIFSRHGGHFIFDLLRLYCRYLCLHMSLIGVRVLVS